MCSDKSTELICIIYNYQTLLTGLIAIISAFATIYFIRQQIHQNEKLENNRIKRLYVANKSVLALSLNDIGLVYKHATHHIYELITLVRESQTINGMTQNDLNIVFNTKIKTKYTIDPNTINNIKSLIEYSDTHTAAHFNKLLNILCTNLTRLNGLEKNNYLSTDRESILIQILSLILHGQALIHSTYLFSRDFENTIKCPNEYSDKNLTDAYNYLMPQNHFPNNLKEQLKALIDLYLRNNNSH